MALGNKIGDAFIEVGASFAGFGKNLGSEVANSLISQTATIGGALEKFGQAVFTKFSVPLIAATTANIAQFQSLDRSIREVITLFGTAPSLVGDTFEELQDGIRGVAKEVGGLESDIADGLYQTISAGIDRDQAFEFLDVAQMAAFADKTSDLTTAVSGLSTVVNAFGLEADDAERIADAMFKTVALGKTTFGELSSDIGRVAPLAANAGVAFEELLAVTGSMTLQGLSTAEAISFIRAAITGLLRPSEEMDQIFREIGHSSAEAAIPVIGLQAAFQAVFEAAGGSTSKLQELIGTSEGVTAALAITGDNAGKFESVLKAIENSGGTASNAFAIMDQSVGRSFGRVTEAFDRMGNSFGELSSKFAVPIFDALVGILDQVAANFGNLEPIVNGLATAFGVLISAFQLPVIKEVVSTFATLGVTLGGLIGVLGLAALAVGNLLQVLAATATGRLALDLFTRAQLALSGALQTGAKRADAFGTVLRNSAVPATTALGKGVQGAGKAMGILANATLKNIGAFTAIGLGISGLIALFGKFIEDQKRINESVDVFGKQTDKLIESLGLVNQAITLPGIDEGIQKTVDFESANLDLLNTLQSVRDTMGEVAATQLAESMVAAIVLHGGTAEDALALQKILEDLLNLDLKQTTTSLNNAGAAMETYAQGVDVATEKFLAFVDANTSGLLNRTDFTAPGFKGEIDNLVTGLTNLLGTARLSGNFDPFIQRLQTLKTELADTPEVAEALGSALNNALKIQLQKPDLDLTGLLTTEAHLLDPDFLMQALRDAGVSLEIQPEIVPPKLADNFPLDVNLGEAFTGPGFGGLFETKEEFDAARKAAEELGFALIEIKGIGDEGVAAYRNLASGMESTFQRAEDQVLGAMTAIRDGVMSQQPLLDVYTGKVKQSFDEWKRGQDQFQADIQAVTTLRDTLVKRNLPEELIAAFDRQPIDKQAWLAGLGAGDLETALQELRDSFELTDQASHDRIMQSFEGIMDDARTLIGEEYDNLQDDAALAGPLVADKFNQMFSLAASKWPQTAAFWMGQMFSNIPGFTIPVPGFTPPPPDDFITPDVGRYAQQTFNQEINVYNPQTNNLVTDVQRALYVARTARIGTPNGKVS